VSSAARELDIEPPTLFHVTHWKAGSQWVYSILRELSPAHIVEPRVDQAQFFVAPLVSGAVYPTVYVTREQFHSVPLPAGYRKFVVVRDLRDTLVSAYFSLRYSHALSADHMALWRETLNKLTMEKGLLQLIDNWLPMCASIQESWISSKESIVRYEQLLTNDFDVLEKVLIEECGIPASREQLRKIVARNRFGSADSGRKRGEEDIHAHQRKGIAGDWKNHFTPKIERAFYDRYGDLLARAGYDEGNREAFGTGLNPVALSKDEILRSYDAVSKLNPHIPHLNLWRAWETTAFQKFSLGGRALNLGCRDGRYFRLIWPHADDAVGYEVNEGAAELARLSGVYTDVQLCSPDALAAASESVDTVFASLVLNQVGTLDRSLSEIHRCLKPGGRLLCSVLTDRFVQWSVLPNLLLMADYEVASKTLRKDIVANHGLTNLLSMDQWRSKFSESGWELEAQVLLLPKFNAGSFLLMDGLWHLKRAGWGELGDTVFPFLAPNENFSAGFRQVVAGLYDMETDWRQGAGAAFVVRKAR
jgi:SAM-dependent methyltransferase